MEGIDNKLFVCKLARSVHMSIFDICTFIILISLLKSYFIQGTSSSNDKGKGKDNSINSLLQ